MRTMPYITFNDLHQLHTAMDVVNAPHTIMNVTVFILHASSLMCAQL